MQPYCVTVNLRKMCGPARWLAQTAQAAVRPTTAVQRLLRKHLALELAPGQERAQAREQEVVMAVMRAVLMPPQRVRRLARRPRLR